MSYTKAELERIVDEYDPIQKPYVSNVALPRRLENAAVNMFVDGVSSTSDAILLRSALSDLYTKGEFNYINS